jgi:beta-lactamase class A
VLLLTIPFWYGCNTTPSNLDVTSTPVATPIVVGESPEPTESPTTPDVIDKRAERRHLLDRVSIAIQAAREEFPGECAIHFIDIESDLSLDVEGNRQFESASLMKLVVITELYRLVQVGQLDIDHPLTLERKHIVGGSGDLKDLEPGLTFPIRVLAEKMITQSDNTATQMLTDFLTKDALNDSTKNLGLQGTTINRDIYDFAAIERGQDNYITAKDAAVLLSQLAREELPGSEQIHAILERQQRNDMIGSGMPKNIKIAHKTGELNGVVHDVGIVYAPRGSYVLSMLSDKVTNKEMAVKVFSKLSQEIYQIYESASPSPTPSPTQTPPTE